MDDNVPTVDDLEQLFPKVFQMAEEARAGRLNYIQISTREDRSAVVLTTVVDNQPLAWITYDAEQLDELLRLLQAHREDLRG